MTLTDEEIQTSLEWCEGSQYWYVKDDGRFHDAMIDALAAMDTLNNP